MVDKKETYLKCNYSNGFMDFEYLVKFNGCEDYNLFYGGVMVMKENVLIKDKLEGLVKIVVVRKDEKTSQILIPSTCDSGSFFKVPNEDIIFDKNQ